MTRKIPLTLALAALVGFAAPALAAEGHAARHDPQVAASTTKKATPAKAEQKAKSVKGRHHAKASKAAAKAPAAQPATPAAK